MYSTTPYKIILGSATTYTFLLRFLRNNTSSEENLRTTIKSISALHATATTALALYTLTQQWPIPETTVSARSKKSSVTGLNDDANPMIAGKNALADLITAWEVGYFIYDTSAIYLVAYLKNKPGENIAALRRLIRNSPVIFTHHVVLIIALFYLQTYIAMGREKGVWVIMAFLFQNASTPLLHLRWWNYRRTRKRNWFVDGLLVTGFAFARFGGVYWVMQRYGQFHGLGAWEAFMKQRLPCRAGTGLLTGVNFVWWVGLLLHMGRRQEKLRTRTEKGVVEREM